MKRTDWSVRLGWAVMKSLPQEMVMKITPTKQKIIDAAHAEFSQNGFYQTVVSDIADRAGVGKGTVYRHFGSKEHLFGFLITRGIGRLEDGLSEVLAVPQSPVEALKEIVRVYFEVVEESRPLHEIIVVEGLQHIGRVQDDFMNSLYRLRSRFSTLFTDGIAEGVFVDRDPDQMATIFQGLIWSVLRSSVVFNEPLGDDALQQIILDICLHGFLKQ